MIDGRCLRDQTDRLYLILKGSRYKNKATPKFPQQMIKTANERESQMILSAFPFFCESPCACVRHSSRYVFCSYLVLLERYSMVKNQDCYRYIQYVAFLKVLPVRRAHFFCGGPRRSYALCSSHSTKIFL